MDPLMFSKRYPIARKPLDPMNSPPISGGSQTFPVHLEPLLEERGRGGLDKLLGKMRITPVEQNSSELREQFAIGTFLLNS